ncbi:EnvZ/OmpR regulon moderator MzrA [Erwinia mallotivora]|uniref:Modulator protein MzrA n=1 Tax=Erwinia mallotivora TaxID=69222 RepID=A0A014PTV0_9GAMM|nr:EnvZ/OmpR regulon moderator MzrA [Erwinia mallotivora]EXU74237.1 modulator protein [Erwinia mallotivora]
MLKTTRLRGRHLTLLAVIAALMLTLFLPVLLRNESALHIRASRQGVALPDGFYVYERLNAEGIQIKSITLDDNALVIRFDTPTQSAAAEKVLRQLLPFDFNIARQEHSASADWSHRISLYQQAVS